MIQGIGYLNLYFDLKSNLESELLALVERVIMRLSCQLSQMSVLVAINMKKVPFRVDSQAWRPHSGDRPKQRGKACSTRWSFRAIKWPRSPRKLAFCTLYKPGATIIRDGQRAISRRQVTSQVRNKKDRRCCCWSSQLSTCHERPDRRLRTSIGTRLLCQEHWIVGCLCETTSALFILGVCILCK